MAPTAGCARTRAHADVSEFSPMDSYAWIGMIIRLVSVRDFPSGAFFSARSVQRLPRPFRQLPANSPGSARTPSLSTQDDLYQGEVDAGSGAPDSVSRSADTSAASAAPIRWKIASASSSLSSASAVRPTASPHRPRPASA